MAVVGGGGVAGSLYRAEPGSHNKGLVDTAGEMVPGGTTSQNPPDLSSNVEQLKSITAQLKDYVGQDQHFLTYADRDVSALAAKLQAITSSLSPLMKATSNAKLADQFKALLGQKGAVMAHINDAGQALDNIKWNVGQVVTN